MIQYDEHSICDHVTRTFDSRFKRLTTLSISVLLWLPELCLFTPTVAAMIIDELTTAFVQVKVASILESGSAKKQIIVI